MRWRSRQRRRPSPTEDPLRALEVQIRLGELSDEMQRIQADAQMFARAQRYLAVEDAYDALLREACRMAGLVFDEVPLGERVAADDRFQAELALSSRGWSW